MGAVGSLRELTDAGRFREALVALASIPLDLRRSPKVAAIESELLVETGDLSSGTRLATRVSSSGIDPTAQSIALRVLGQAAFYRGDAADSLRYLQQARDLSTTVHPNDAKLLASILLVKWRL